MSDYEETEKRGYPLPVPTNNVSDDVETLRTALEMIGIDVDALIMAMAGKAATVHAHTIGDVDGLDSALDGKSNAGHAHSLGELSNVVAAVDSAATGSVFYKTASGWAAGNPAVILGNHEHTIDNVQGLQLALDAKLDATSLPAAFASLTTKSTIADTDGFIGADASDSGKAKRFLWSSIKAALKTYFDALYSLAGHVHAVATTSVAGFMSASDKSKLDGIAAGAQVNPGVATTSANGLMSSADKAKLNGIATGATANSTDAALLNRANHTGTQAFTTLSGTATASQIPNLDASKITSGTLPISRGGTGQTTEAGMRGVYTGTVAGNTAYPIGTVIIVAGTTNLPNTTVNIRVYTDGGTGAFYNTAGTGGAAVAGTWRSRGYATSGPGTVIGLAQRVA